MLTEPWRISLLGTFHAVSGPYEFNRCATRKTEELLALLAYRLGQQCSRAELADTFWPDSEIEASFTNLRGSLLSIRRQLEPTGVPKGSVVVSHGRHAVSLNPEFVTCDVVDFMRLIKQRTSLTREERTRRLVAAIELYKGELLPGFDEGWIETIRTSLAQQFFNALREVSTTMADAGDLELAIQHAHRAVEQEPYREEPHCDLMRLYALAGRTEDAVRTYENMAKLFERERLDPPSIDASRLLEEVRKTPRTSTPRMTARQATVWRPPEPKQDDCPSADVMEPSGTPVAPPPVHPAPRPVEPAWEEVDSVRRADTGIPLQFTRFFGREQDLRRLDDLVRSPYARLITIIGPGGIGKTRLSVEYAAKAVTSLGRRILFVPLDHLHSGQAATARLAEALGIPLRPGDPDTVSQVEEELRERPTLLVLDNLEQIVDEVAPLLLRLMGAVTTLCVIATSRQALELTGEQLLPLEPLPVPDRTVATPEELITCPSVQLFVDRATRVMPDFAITERNARDVATVCRELEGLPLSIELAAALAQDLTPKQMVRDLSRKFDLLVSRKRDVPERHATLRACLEWSYRLLPPHLADAFAGLSVFRGGFSVESAGAVLALDSPFATLQELRSRSLITAQRTDEEVRYGMLDALHAFAAEKLADNAREQLAQRHALFFGRLCVEAEPYLWRSRQTEWLSRLTTEAPNLRAALAWSLANDPGTAIHMGRDLGRFWIIKGYWTEGRDWLTRCADAAGARQDTLSEGALLSLCGALAACEGDREEALTHAEKGVSLVRSQNDPVALARSLINLGIAYDSRGDVAEARAVFDEALRHAEAHGVKHVAAVALTNAASACIAAGDLAQASALTERAFSLARELGDDWLCSVLLMHLGDIACEQDEAEAARRHYAEALDLLFAAGDLVHAARVLWQLAAVLAYQDDASGGAYLVGAAETIQTKNGVRFDADAEAAHRDIVAILQNALASAHYEQMRAQGAQADPSDVLAWLRAR